MKGEARKRADEGKGTQKVSESEPVSRGGRLLALRQSLLYDAAYRTTELRTQTLEIPTRN